MSVLFGIFQRDGQPVNPAHLETMQKAFGSWEGDHDDIWHKDSMGMGIRQRYETERVKEFEL